MWHPPTPQSLLIVGAPSDHLLSINSHVTLATALCTTIAIAALSDIFKETYQASPYTARKPRRPHSTEVPDPPRRYGEVAKHRFCKDFREAEVTEFDILVQKGTFKIVLLSEALYHYQVPLPLMWTYVYKFLDNGLIDRLQGSSSGSRRPYTRYVVTR